MLSDTSQMLEDKKRKANQDLSISRQQTGTVGSMSRHTFMPEQGSPTSPRKLALGLSINVSPRGHSHNTRGSPTRSNASPARLRLGEREPTRDELQSGTAVPGTAKLRFLDMKAQPLAEQLEYLDTIGSESSSAGEENYVSKPLDRDKYLVKK